MNGCAAWAIIIASIALSIGIGDVESAKQAGLTDRAAISAGLHQDCSNYEPCRWVK